MTDYKLVLAFDTNDPEFTRGFECGQIWSSMEHINKAYMITKKAEIDMPIVSIRTTIHVANTEMIMRMCEAENFEFKAEPFGEDWMTVTLTPSDLCDEKESE